MVISWYLVSLGHRVLDACIGLHVVSHSLIHCWCWGQNPVLEALSASWEPTLLRRKDRFLILQTALHYELIVRGAPRPAGRATNTKIRQTPGVTQLLN